MPVNRVLCVSFVIAVLTLIVAATPAKAQWKIWSPKNVSTSPCNDDERHVLTLLFPEFVSHHFGGPRLALRQFAPKGRSRKITPQDAGLYQEELHLPCVGEQYSAALSKQIFQSAEDQTPGEVRICYKRLKDGGPEELHLNCILNGDCKEEHASGWIELCERDDNREAQWWWPIRPAFAKASTLPGWAVPTEETLNELSDNDRPGYSQFWIDSDNTLPFEGATHFTFAVWVNGTPIYFDGAPHHSLPIGLTKDGELSFSFPLENLVFKGRRAGTDAIRTEFRVHAGEDHVGTIDLTRDYKALRDAPLIKTVSDGIRLEWEAEYNSPRIANKFEIFIYSTRSRDRAMALRERVDALGGEIEGLPVVGSVRPPLGNNKSYGVVLALENANGQVQFTFDEMLANKVCRWSLDQRKRSRGRQVIDKQVYRYENEPRAPGVSKLKFCKNLG
jgi:hypothetical protein